MKNARLLSGITLLALASLFSAPASGEESHTPAARAGELASATEQAMQAQPLAFAPGAQKLLGGSTGCSISTWTPGTSGVCVYAWCYSGCSSLDCVYGNGYEEHTIAPGCSIPENPGPRTYDIF